MTFRLSLSYNLVRRFHSNTTLLRYVESTAVRYPNLKRGNYGKLSDKNVKFFQSILEPHQVITDPSDIEGYNVDWLNTVRGKYFFTYINVIELTLLSIFM